MRLSLILITNDPLLAQASVAAGIDRVLVDLEQKGKAERQRGRGLFLSAHTWEDVKFVRAVVPPGALLVRLDPLHEGTPAQISRAVDLGADTLMLPYFHDAQSVSIFCDLVAGAARVLPLVETRGAVNSLESLLAAGVISAFHVGLNDLAIDMGRRSLQDLWGDPILDEVANLAETYNALFGIGGVTDPRVRGLPMNPSWVIAEQRRLGATCAFLGRNFRMAHEANPDIARIRNAVSAIQTVYQAAGHEPTNPSCTGGHSTNFS